jgi:hypothetical protein
MKEDEWEGNVARMGEMRNLYRILFEKPERKRSFKRSSCCWEDNVKVGLKYTGYEGVSWV